MTSKKQQVVFIHGGDSFDTKEEFYESLKNREYDPYEPEPKRWRDALQIELEDRGYEWIFLKMPCRWNADYTAWSIWYEKLIPFLNDGVVLIGHSLGGSFLTRYLSEHTLPISVESVHLVAPAVLAAKCHGLGEFGTNLEHFEGFKTSANVVDIYHSSDDEVVPIEHSEALAAALPEAHLHQFTDRGHFLGEEFPEIKANILSRERMDTTNAND